jgi:hypothetical protein
MCCSTGVCGPNPDPELARLARDLAWLKHNGVEIERFNLAQEPKSFVENPAVLAALQADDTACLPIVIVDGEIVSRKSYPSREQLFELLGIPAEA